MQALYNIGIYGLQCIMWLASRFHTKAKKWIQGRKVNILDFKVPADQKVVWFHCASLGEFDQGLPVMNAYKTKHPNCFLLVTFFSPSGIEFYNKRDHHVDLAIYLPLDTPSKAKEFCAHFHPSEVFFVKYEFWYNHLKAAKEIGAKIYGVSSLFRPSHRFFKWYGGFFRKALRLFDHFFTQDERSSKLLAEIGILQTTNTGDTRYDRMLGVVERNEANEFIEAFVQNESVILLGSSWPADEELLLPALLEFQKEYKIIIAPHDISEQHVLAISAYFKNEVERYTSFADSTKRILIIDTIGQLTSAYKYATVAYIGGGLTGKLHNILEPGAFGIPVIFGPKFERFPEAQLFIDHKVATTVNSSSAFHDAVLKCIERKEEISNELGRIFELNKGAAQKVVEAVS